MPELRIEDAVLGDLEPELAAARRVLERIPDDAWDFRPHPDVWTLGELANHLTQLLFWMQTTLDRDEFDAQAAGDEGRVVAEDRAALLQGFDDLAGRVREAARHADAAYLASPWVLRAGPHVVFSMPRAMALRQMCLSHLVHHRAQLGLYLRLRGVAPPPLYGAEAV